MADLFEISQGAIGVGLAEAGKINDHVPVALKVRRLQVAAVALVHGGGLAMRGLAGAVDDAEVDGLVVFEKQAEAHADKAVAADDEALHRGTSVRA